MIRYCCQMLLGSAALSVIAMAATVRAQEPTVQTRPTGVSHAELFIASFGSAGSAQALRTSELQMREQVRLAFYGIDATRVEVEKGRLSKEEGERIIDTFKETLRNYIHDHSGDALIVASSGQVQDIPKLVQFLGALMGVARQDALMGREEAAQEAQAKMLNVLRTFSQRFAETCEQQTFPVEVALGLQRQNELLGTGIDLWHCANRRLSATLEHTRVKYLWENCSVDGSGEWKVTLSGFLSGKGRTRRLRVGSDGFGVALAEVTTRVEGPSRYTGKTDDWNLRLELRISGRTEMPSSTVVVPNDAGPNARPNGWPQAPVPQTRPTAAFKVGTLRMDAIRVIGDGYYPTPRDWIEGPIRLEERPCTPGA